MTRVGDHGSLTVAEAPRSTRRWPWLAVTALAILLAAYSGFRLPSLWSVTLYNVSWGDGTQRRGLAGTVLAPLWQVGGHAYATYATVAFTVLLAVLAVIVVAVSRARWNAQRALVLVWVLAPTGAFLFHEVGYLDQVVYLLLIASLVLWSRTSPFISVLPVAASVLVHEVALLATWPILAWFACRDGVTRQRLAALAVPLGVGVVVLTRPPLSAQSASHLIARLDEALPFPIRTDAIDLYGRTQADAWTHYSPLGHLVGVMPFAAAMVISLLGVVVATRDRRARRDLAWAVPVVVAPLLLVFGGWDAARWVFLAFANLTIVGYLWLERRAEPPPWLTVAVMLVPFLLLLVAPLPYFDGYAPRMPTPAGVAAVVDEPDFLRFPTG